MQGCDDFTLPFTLLLRSWFLLLRLFLPCLDDFCRAEGLRVIVTSEAHSNCWSSEFSGRQFVDNRSGRNHSVEAHSSTAVEETCGHSHTPGERFHGLAKFCGPQARTRHTFGFRVILNKCGFTLYDIFGFFGPPFEKVQFLPLMTFCLFLGPTHFSSGFKHILVKNQPKFLPFMTFWPFLGPPF